MAKDLVEECIAISVREIPKDGIRRTTWGGFTLTTITPRFGGLRYWFLCPRCGRWVGTLYKTDADAPWACRCCHNLAYRSQQLSKNPFLRRLQVLDRFDILRARVKAGEAAALKPLLKLTYRMLQELARERDEGSTQTNDAAWHRKSPY